MNHVAFPRFAALVLPLAALFAPGCVVEQAEIDLGEEAIDESSEAVVTVRHENKISQGRDHACAINASGALYCWGRNLYGQVGDGIAPSPGGDTTCEAGTTNSSPCYANPKLVVGMSSGVSAVSAGTYHTCAINAAGQVSCWGRTMYGAVGIDLPEGTCGAGWTSTPQPVSLPESAVDIAVGVYHSCALTTSGRVFCWGLATEVGNPDNSQTFCGTLHGHDTPTEVFFSDVPTNVKAVTRLASAPSRGTTCAVHVDGGVSCWGAPDEGANPDIDNLGGFVPQAVVRGFGTANATRLTGASAAAIDGYRGACALFAQNGTVECWAPLSTAGCGRGGSPYHCTPEPTPVVEQTANGTTTLVNAVQLSGGEATVCAMTTDNTPRCWNTNDTCVVGSGPFGMSAAQPMTNADGTAIKTAWSIVVGGQTSCVRRQDGSIYCLGADAQAEHGDGAATVKHCSQNRGGGNLLMSTIP